ncbi:MAG TPA: squalene/phytoene synthase family protein, partial [Bryobacteraceae bacterium]|nr:squalene/phytoene synthase family protein [Bryobacteraceae bacterium]
MNETLQRSYEYCRQVARSRARNFYYSFVLLPKPQRQAICAIYAFMRRCDDLSDDAPRDGCP